MAKRLIIFFAVLMAGFFGMVGRLGYLSGSSRLIEAASRQGHYTITVSEQRAAIYDRNMLPLVDTAESYCAIVMPDERVADDAMRLSGLSFNEISAKLRQRRPFLMDINSPYSGNGSIVAFKKSSRYSDNQPAAHIIGYLNPEKTNGITGIELAFDEFLNEHRTRRSVSFTVDAWGRMVKGGEISVTGENGGNSGVVLTIDRGIQSIAERIGGRMIDRGAVVISDPQTGEIAAMASFPLLDPNNLAVSVNDTVNTPMINRALLPYAVGSVFKTVTSAAALESGISPETAFYCAGRMTVDGHEFRCHNLGGCGNLDMSGAVRSSCNTYFIEIARLAGASRISQTASDMGFGKYTLLAPYIRDSAGYLPSMNDLRSSGEFANMSFGQGKLLATPLQINSALSAVISGGRYMPPTLVKGTTTDGVNIDSTDTDSNSVTVMSAETASRLKQMLTAAVMDAQGQNAKPQTVTAGGKTGTAQTGLYRDDGGEVYRAWFSGFFPADQPIYAITVLVEDGPSGNSAAAPVFSKLCDEITAYLKWAMTINS
ncbi:MAG: penicillin-binding transpeptidase domain-containing protein [Oscillospiraceae bacterium]|nr:penicillin-binding transpeptidase domain-containing protein [Oscillospiraceae bacterium]